MDPLTIISILGSVAPSLVKWATNSDQAAKVATAAVQAAKVLTGKDDPNEQVAALQADPALAIQFRQQMLQQNTDFEKLYVDDKASARARDIALNSTPRGNVRANWLVAFAILTITGILLLIVFKPSADEFVKSTLTLILGMYINELKNIYSFEFGTTRRSRQKSDVINDMSDN